MSARTFHRASGVVSLSMAEYYLGPASEVSVRHDPRPGEDSASVPWCRPVLLLSLQSNSTVDDFARKIESFYEKDDVFSDDFLTDIIIVQAGNPERTPTVPWSKLQRKTLMGEWSPIHVVETDDRSHLPEGPYFFTAGNVLAQAWKLYPDSQDAFATTIVPSEEDPNTFKPLDGVYSGGVWRQVAVPSRLYSPVTDKKPLAGLRISVKDNFKIAGVKTILGNRAFVDTYGPDKDTAVFLQTLIQKDQWVDFHAPFNPRADGYQSPSGSSTGAAASLASYKWLDYSLGTDTTGSIRWPAAWNGFFGFRTTWNAGSLEGVYPSCRHMDALGFLSRDISQLHRILEKSLPALETASEPPKEILYTTDFFPHPNAAQQSLVEGFVAVLERHLGILKTDFSIEDRWTECPPEEAQGKTIRECIEKTAYYPFYYDGYNEFSQFRSQYEETHGKPVYVGPDQAAKVRLEQKEKALEENEVYRRWFQSNILRAEGHGSSTAIMIVPCGSGEPKYRDLPNSAPGIVPAFSPNYIASMLGLPQVVLPIGQIPFRSRISNRTEYLPTVASIVGAPGSDLMLLQLAKDVLRNNNLPTSVDTGRLMFKL